MSYVIYRVSDTYAVRGKYGSIKRFKTEAAAKGGRTRYLKKHASEEGHGLDDWAIAESVDFHENIEHKVVKKNLLSGKHYTESRNTPRHCSPSSEAYWSM